MFRLNVAILKEIIYCSRYFSFRILNIQEAKLATSRSLGFVVYRTVLRQPSCFRKLSFFPRILSIH